MTVKSTNYVVLTMLSTNLDVTMICHKCKMVLISNNRGKIKQLRTRKSVLDMFTIILNYPLNIKVLNCLKFSISKKKKLKKSLHLTMKYRKWKLANIKCLVQSLTKNNFLHVFSFILKSICVTKIICLILGNEWILKEFLVHL